MPTQGFQLSQFSRAPQVPGGIGDVDVKGIYDSVVNSLRAHEAMQATAGRQAETEATQLFNTQKANLGTQEALAAGPGVLDAAAATRNKNILSSAESTAALPGVGPLATARTSVAGDIVSGNQEKAIERERNAKLLQQAQAEELQARGEISNAINLADHGTRANDLSQIRVKYPWLELPQYKDLAGVLDSHLKNSLTESEKAKDRELSQELTVQRGQSALDVAKARSSSNPAIALTRRQVEIMEALQTDPENDLLKAELNGVTMALNKISATAPNTPVTQAKKIEGAVVQSLWKELPKTATKIASAESDVATVLAAMDRVEQEVLANPEAIGWKKKMGAGAIPHTSTSRIESDMPTILSNGAFTKLADIRASSPTGGAVGNVSDADMKLLQAAAGNLVVGSGNPQLFLQVLRDRREMLKKNLERVKAAYVADQSRVDNFIAGSAEEGGAGGRPSTPAPTATADKHAEAIQWAQQHPDDPRAKEILKLHGR